MVRSENDLKTHEYIFRMNHTYHNCTCEKTTQKIAPIGQGLFNNCAKDAKDCMQNNFHHLTCFFSKIQL